MYKKGYQGWRKHLDFMIIDIIAMQFAVIAAYILRYGWKFPYAHSEYLDLAILLTVVDWIVAFFFNSYKNVLKRNTYKEFAATVKHVFLLLMVVIFYLFSVKKAEVYSRIFMYFFVGIYAVVSFGVRLLWKKYLTEHSFGKEQRSLLVITESDKAEAVLEKLKQDKGDRFCVTGIVLTDLDKKDCMIGDVPVVANVSDVVEYVCREWVDEVLIRLSVQTPEVDKMISYFMEMGITLHQVIIEKSHGTSKQFVEKMGDYMVVTSSINSAAPQQLLMKRLLDIVGGLVGCLCTAVIYLFIAPLIKKESPGPVFFSQIRVGKNGRKFKIYKFRSMYLDAEERKKELMAQNRVKDGMMFKLEFDPRIIGTKKLPDGTVKRGIGNIIRDYSLDEFPQFYNVLKGDMSLVGTRPPTVDEWEKYELHHRARLATKPGITGMWQVSGRSNITDFEEVVKLDTKYIAEWNFWLDLKILFKTVTSVLKKEGSM